jgi:hypothetical protein
MLKMSRENSSALLAPNQAERQKLAFSPLQMGIGMPTHNNSIFISLQGFLGPAQFLSGVVHSNHEYRKGKAHEILSK